jgi:molecular chaperone GrpE
MSPQDNDAGGSRHWAPGTGGERDSSAPAGPPGPFGNGSSFDDDSVVEAELIDAGPAGTADDPEAGEDELIIVSRQRDEYLDMVRRVQADFENYKKRTQRQQSDQLDRATENLVAKLLPALDAFALTRAHLNDESGAAPEVKALLQAAGLIDDVLAKEGLERIDDAGAPFDPTIHDAVEHAPAPEPGGPGPVPGGLGTTGPATAAVAQGPVVADVLRPGYRWKGRVIRPAMVRVRG